MYKTLRQLADELGISKQKIYRFVKENHINEAVQDGQVKRYDETAQKQIKSHFTENKPSHQTASETHRDTVYNALIKQMEILDKQLREKDKQIELLLQTIDQEQKLNALNQQKIAMLEQTEAAKQKKIHWWNKKKQP